MKAQRRKGKGKKFQKRNSKFDKIRRSNDEVTFNLMSEVRSKSRYMENFLYSVITVIFKIFILIIIIIIIFKKCIIGEIFQWLMVEIFGIFKGVNATSLISILVW